MKEFHVTVTIDDGEDFREFDFEIEAESLDDARNAIAGELDIAY